VIGRAAPPSFSRIPTAALDTLPPTPSATLFSAEDVTQRLREIVEGFFFRRLSGEDGKGIRRLLVKSPPGLTTSTEAIGHLRQIGPRPQVTEPKSRRNSGRFQIAV
jgi:hypothetical protein